jgi:monolysocardiolipin acyltransferase
MASRPPPSASDPPIPSRPETDALLAPPWGPLGRSATLATIATACKIGLTGLATFSIAPPDGVGAARLAAAVAGRPPGIGLLTVMNHTSTLDDPGVFSAALPLSLFATDHLSGRAVRWSLCAREVCHSNPALSAFFRSGKTLAIERGGGVDQPSTRAAADALASGGWVHVFPEGKVSPSGKLGRLRWGVGALVCGCVAAGGAPPALLPLYHSGMATVLPLGSVLPRPLGKDLHLAVGEAIPLGDLTPGCTSADPEVRASTWAAITARAEAGLKALEAAAPPNPDQRRPEQVAADAAAGEAGTGAGAGALPTPGAPPGEPRPRPPWKRR